MWFQSLGNGNESLAKSTSTPFHEQQVFTRQHGLAALVENFQRLDHHAGVRLLVVAFSLDGHADADGVADEYRLDEVQPVVRALPGSHSHFDGR